MKKRQRPSFLRILERRYGKGRPRRDQEIDRADPHGGRGPVVYPVKKVRRLSSSGKGVIDMPVQQFVMLALGFILISVAASVTVSYAAVELAGAEGPRGEVGPIGPRGDEGPQGLQGEMGEQGLPGDDAAFAMVERLAELWAIQQASGVRGGIFVELEDPEVQACVDYILTGEPNLGVCPGFSAAEE